MSWISRFLITIMTMKTVTVWLPQIKMSAATVPLWQFFLREKGGKARAKCKLCQGTCFGSAGNIRGHLFRSYCSSCPQPVGRRKLFRCRSRDIDPFPVVLVQSHSPMSARTMRENLKLATTRTGATLVTGFCLYYYLRSAWKFAKFSKLRRRHGNYHHHHASFSGTEDKGAKEICSSFPPG